MRPDITDSELQLMLQQGKEAALEYLFRTHYADMCRAANRILRDPRAAEDLSQEVFYELWRRRDKLSIQSSLAAYLRRAVVNRSLNYLRDQRLPLAEMEEMPDMATRPGLTSEGLEQAELRERIRLAIDQLPERCRLVFVLNRFEELSNREIAERLSISVKTVENQMTRALKMLRESLGHLLVVMVGLILLVWTAYVSNPTF